MVWNTDIGESDTTWNMLLKQIWEKDLVFVNSIWGNNKLKNFANENKNTEKLLFFGNRIIGATAPQKLTSLQ